MNITFKVHSSLSKVCTKFYHQSIACIKFNPRKKGKMSLFNASPIFVLSIIDWPNEISRTFHVINKSISFACGNFYFVFSNRHISASVWYIVKFYFDLFLCFLYYLFCFVGFHFICNSSNFITNQL